MKIQKTFKDALLVLSYMSKNKGKRLSLNDISMATNIDRDSVYRAMKTLKAKNFVQSKTGFNGGYDFISIKDKTLYDLHNVFTKNKNEPLIINQVETIICYAFKKIKLSALFKD